MSFCRVFVRDMHSGHDTVTQWMAHIRRGWPMYNLETEIPKLDALALAAHMMTERNVKVCIRYQMDGAGPHQDKTLIDALESEFNKRG